MPTDLIVDDRERRLSTNRNGELIPDAEIKIYRVPDANHGSIFQYPAEAAEDVNAFLGGSTVSSLMMSAIR